MNESFGIPKSLGKRFNEYGWDCGCYRDRYPDLKATGWDCNRLLDHWKNYGMSDRERRIPGCGDPNTRETGNEAFVKEKSLLALGNFHGAHSFNDIEIEEAWYGLNRFRYKRVHTQIKRFVNNNRNNNGATQLVDHELFGVHDPAPGIPKFLYIRWTNLRLRREREERERREREERERREREERERREREEREQRKQAIQTKDWDCGCYINRYPDLKASDWGRTYNCNEAANHWKNYGMRDVERRIPGCGDPNTREKGNVAYVKDGQLLGLGNFHGAHSFNDIEIEEAQYGADGFNNLRNVDNQIKEFVNNNRNNNGATKKIHYRDLGIPDPAPFRKTVWKRGRFGNMVKVTEYQQKTKILHIRWTNLRFRREREERARREREQRERERRERERKRRERERRIRDARTKVEDTNRTNAQEFNKYYNEQINILQSIINKYDAKINNLQKEQNIIQGKKEGFSLMGVKESIISIPEGKNTIKQINKDTDTSIQKIEELKNQIDILKNKITNIPKGDRRVSELNTEIYKLRQNIANMEVKINIRKNQKTADKNNINYYNMLLTQNKTIKKEYDNLKTMFDTGNQKTGYMNPYVEKLQKIKNVLFIVYFLVVIIYAYFIYFPWSWDKLTTKTLYMLLFVAFPYIISFVELHLINMFRFLYSFIFDIPFRKFHM